MNERPIKYEPHPVSPARKAELIAAGFKIIDIKFAPPVALTAAAPWMAAVMAPPDLAFPGTDDTRTFAEVDAQIKADNAPAPRPVAKKVAAKKKAKG